MNKQNVFEVDERESDPTQMVHTKFQCECQLQILGSGSHRRSLFLQLCTSFGQWVIQWVTFDSYMQLSGSGSHSGSFFIAMYKFWVVGHIVGSLLRARCNFWVVGHIVGNFSQLCATLGQWVKYYLKYIFRTLRF